MAKTHIASYLNDHLAGTVTALDLLESLRGRAGPAMERDLAGLQVEIAVDRQELESLMTRLQIPESRTRKATAWIGVKLTEIKLQMEDSGDLHLLEAFDTLSIGIEGKALLWRALAAASIDAPSLQGPEYERLIQRAEAQRGQVEKLRLSAARAALSRSN